MGYVLKTRDGAYLTRPITHPATDDQVYGQLTRMQQQGLLILPTEDLAPRLQELEDQVLGEETPSVPEVSWNIGIVNESTGAVTGDSQGMRIVSNLLTAEVAMTVSFSNTAKYKYQIYRYNAEGQFVSYDISWQSAASFSVEKGTSVVIKVRENSYTVWDAEKIAAFAATVTLECNPNPGFARRMDSLEEQTQALLGMDSTVRSNTNSILALKNTVSTLSSAGSAALLLQYDDNFFPQLESGEISWETGQELPGGDFVRSVGYRLVSGDDAVFVVNLPNSQAIASFYAYSLENGSYVFQAVSDWYYNGGTFHPEKGKYYRVLYYNVSGLAPDSLRVLLSGSVLTQLLESMEGEKSHLLAQSLTAAQELEMEETSAAITAAMDDPASALVGFFTDLHLECGVTGGTNITRTKNHLTMYNRLCQRHKMDLLLLGGDYLQNSSLTVKAQAAQALGLLKELLGKTDPSAPMAVLKGNHDDNTLHTDYVNGYLSDGERWTLLQNADEDATCRDVAALEKSYGYYDIPNRKIRVFYLNSVDVPTQLDQEANTLAWGGQNRTGFSGEQIQFVADHLKFDEEGWQVLFFSHHPIKRNPYPSPMTNVGVTAANGGSVLEQVLQGFLTKNQGQIQNTTADFTYTVSFDFSQNKSNTIIACINGHTHYDCHAYLDGINWIATRAIDGHATYGFQDTSVYVVVNRKKRIVSLIANGEGEDRAYSY